MVSTSLSLLSASVDSQRSRLQVNLTRLGAPASKPRAPPVSTSVFLHMLLVRLQTRRPFVGFVGYLVNTSNLKFHLQRNHTQEYRALERQGSDNHPGPSGASAMKMASKQLTLGGMLAKLTPFSSEV